MSQFCTGNLLTGEASVSRKVQKDALILQVSPGGRGGLQGIVVAGVVSGQFEELRELRWCRAPGQ